MDTPCFNRWLGLVACLVAGCAPPGPPPGNRPPSAPGVSLSPVDPTTRDDLVVRLDAPAVDPDGDPVQHRIEWQRNGEPVADLRDATVPASRTSRDEVWTVIVIASDGWLSGDQAEARVTIRNSPPVITSLVIGPSPATRATSGIEVESVVSADDDGDAFDFDYDWLVNGRAAGGAQSFSPQGSAVGDVITLRLTAFDDAGAGPAFVSNAIVIENNAPTGSVRLSHDRPTSRQVAAGDVSASTRLEDLDGDPVRCVDPTSPSDDGAWTVDGLRVGRGATLRPERRLVRGERVRYACTPRDNNDDAGEELSASFEVANTPPSPSPGFVVGGQPGLAILCAGLAFSCASSATDFDQDPLVGGSVSLLRDANVVASSTGAPVVGPGEGPQAGEAWTCRASASDGRETVTDEVVARAGSCRIESGGDPSLSDWTAFGAPAGSAEADEGVTSIVIPFGFPYDGAVRRTAWVSTNGFVSFVDPVTPRPGHAPSTDVPPLGAAIAPWWDDLQLLEPMRWAAGEEASERFLAIEWPSARIAGTEAIVEFQLRLHEHGDVSIHWGRLSGHAPWSGANVGVRSGDGTSRVRLLSCGDRCSGADFPAGRSFRFTPAGFF